MHMVMNSHIESLKVVSKSYIGLKLVIERSGLVMTSLQKSSSKGQWKS